MVWFCGHCCNLCTFKSAHFCLLLDPARYGINMCAFDFNLFVLLIRVIPVFGG